tara:strand:- start:227 stop:2020 length:1794 start_codon:yes stop_codon:yes gene_type:complete
LTKRPINYTSRDFETIKNDLVNYAKRYYPTSFKDFNEASFGALMLDLVAYVGDQLSFYADFQANESFLDSAVELSNVVRLAQQLGYKLPSAARSSGTCSFFILVPASTSGRGPDLDYFPILQRGSLLLSSGGTTYTLNENVDFTQENNEVTVARVDPETGVPTFFAVKAFGEIVSGQEQQEIISIGDYQRFLSLRLARRGITEITSVTDSQGNEYFEVDYLTQDVVYRSVPNTDSSRSTVPYRMVATPVPRRFSIETNSFGETFLQFGYGSADNLTGDVIVDPADVVLDVNGRNYTTAKTFDPSNLIKSDKFGVVPTNTNLTVVYGVNDSNNINAPVGTISTVSVPQLAFRNQAILDAAVLQTVRSSLEVSNETPILGDVSQLTADEIRIRSYATFASQNRAVTRTDYTTLCYRMPPKFGRVKRVNIVQDKDSLKRNLNLYVLGENSSGNFSAPTTALKQNLKTWISNYRMINDSVDILDASIINYGINFEVIGDIGINKYDLLQNCVNQIRNNLLNVKKNIGEPIYIADIYKSLNEVPGVVDTSNVEIINKVGGVYSDYQYDMLANLSGDGRFVQIPQDSVADLLLPNEDISGVIK